MDRRLLVLFCGILVSGGCAREHDEVTSVTRFNLEVVDSVQLEVMATYLSLMDVHDSTGNLLVIESDPPVVYEFDSLGQFIHRIQLEKDGPESVGRYILAAEYFEDGVALLGVNVLNIYDSSRTLQKSLKLPAPPKGMIYMGFNHLQEAVLEGSKHLTLFNAARTDYPPEQPEYYQYFNLMEYVDPKSANFKAIGKLQQGSRYLNKRAHQFLKPSFHTIGHEVHYAMDTDTVLYVMDIASEEIVKQWKIPFTDFVLFNGFPMGAIGMEAKLEPRDSPGRISNLFYVDSLHIILYNPGIKLHVIEEIKATYGEEQAADRLDSLNGKKYMIMQAGKVVGEGQLPAKMRDVILASPDGYLWASQDVDFLEEEPDQITFYKLRIVAY